MNQIAYPQINKDEAKKFASVWTYNGVAVSLDDTTLQFATDFSNVLLKQVFHQLYAQQMQAQIAQQKQQNVQNTQSVIVEG